MPLLIYVRIDNGKGEGKIPSHVYEAVEGFGACFESRHSAGEIGYGYCGVHAVCEAIGHGESRLNILYRN